MKPRFIPFVALVVFTIGLGACYSAGTLPQSGPATANDRVGSADPDPIAARLILLGDAGYLGFLNKPQKQVLSVLSDTVANLPDRTTAVFLGDNIYGSGMDPNDIEHGAKRINPQIRAVVGSDAGGTAVFVPGNHDWAEDDMRIERIAAQANHVDSVGGGKALFLPDPPGCPGPSVHPLIGPQGDTVLVLVALDTQLLLLDDGAHIPPACESRTVDEVLARLSAVLESAPGKAAVMAHHPLWMVGKHARKRSSGNRQDLFSTEYTKMRNRLAAAMRVAPPLLIAGGHDHSLQVFRGDNLPGEMKDAAEYVLVSGSASKLSAVYTGRFGLAYRRYGFMIVDVHTNGQVQLRLIDARNEELPQLLGMTLRAPTRSPDE